MKDKDYHNLIELYYVGGGFMPYNEKAKEFIEQLSKGEVVAFKIATQRDIAMHRCYFSLLNYIYKYLTNQFQKVVPEKHFYKWIQHLKKEYKVIYSFIDIDKVESIISDCIDNGMNADQASFIAKKYGKTDMIEYESISFGRMNQNRFEEYIKELLPYIYENLIGKFYEGDIYSSVIENIEEEYRKFLSKL